VIAAEHLNQQSTINNSMRTVLEAAATILMMGAVPIIIRHVPANPWTIGLIRLGVATAGMALIVALTRRWVSPTPREWRALALIGVLFAAHWALYFISIKLSSAAIAVIGQSTFGVHLVVLGWVIGHHQVETADLLAVALAVAGSLMVAPRWSLQDADTVGLLLGIVSSFFYAFLPILHQRIAHLSSAMRVLGQFGVGLIMFLPSWPASEWRFSASDWFWLLILAVVCTLVQHTLWTRLTTRLPTLTTSVLFYMAVPVTLVFGVVLLGEQVTGWMLGGAALIVSGNLLALLRRRRR
jgi:drug/metabolite transporter (DMT)-like permease